MLVSRILKGCALIPIYRQTSSFFASRSFHQLLFTIFLQRCGYETQFITESGQQWKQVLSRHCPKIPIILVGTKTDLRGGSYEALKLVDKGQAHVSAEQGIGKAREIGAVKYLECSSLSKEGLKIAVNEALRAAISQPRVAKMPRVCIVL